MLTIHPWIKNTRVGKVVALFFLALALFGYWQTLLSRGQLPALLVLLIGLVLLQIAVVIGSRINVVIERAIQEDAANFIEQMDMDREDNEDPIDFGHNR